MRRKWIPLLLLTALVAVMAAGLALGVHQAVAEGEKPGSAGGQATPSPMHPDYILLDANGVPVSESGEPLSLAKTCGQCHDTEFITTHATHQKAENVPGFAGLTKACYVCHSDGANWKAYQQAYAQGSKWADTALLLGSGVVEKTDKGWKWNADAFWPDGRLKSDYVDIHRPTNANCAQCHGVVHTDMKSPLIINKVGESEWQTFTTGVVVSPQKISFSGMDIVGKEKLTYAWDVHAERGLQCVDCHTSANSPRARRASELPSYLTFEPRHPSPGEFLKEPSHILTKENCESCHDPVASHKDWLPYLKLHMSKVACETCHVPHLYGPAAETVDKTVVLPNGEEKVVYRGVEATAQAPEGADTAEPFTVSHVVKGYEPAVLKRNSDGKLAPYNLITTFQWVYKKDGKDAPISADAVKKAWMPDGKTYAADVVKAFDANKDGKLTADELVIDSQAKEQVIAKRLADLGFSGAHIVGVVKAYPIHHGVVQSDFALNNCQACHGEDSRIGKSLELAAFVPAGAQVSFNDNDLNGSGKVEVKDGKVLYQPSNNLDKVYVAGYHHIWWIDLIGVLAFIGTLLGVSFHGALRYVAAKKHHPHHGKTRREYLYTGAERFWHWTQMASIILLLLIGLAIHEPEWFGIAGAKFRYLVFLHTVFGWILVINFLLAMYYFIAIGYIGQFIPNPKGYIQRAIKQAKFYLSGIFKGEPHPFTKSYWNKLNPLQRMAYFGLIFFLLPVQMITGLWLWAAGIWPQTVTQLLGSETMTYVAATHTLDAWLIAAFVVGHVYLTTTGHGIFDYIVAMITGWEDVEVADDTDAEQA